VLEKRHLEGGAPRVATERRRIRAPKMRFLHGETVEGKPFKWIRLNDGRLTKTFPLRLYIGFWVNTIEIGGSEKLR
jgi:hypothetical protein